MLDNIIEISVIEKIGISDVIGKSLVFFNQFKGILVKNVSQINAYADGHSVFVGLSVLARGPTNINQLSLFSKPLLQ